MRSSALPELRVLRFTANPRLLRTLSEPLRGTLLNSARTPRRNVCSDPCCACCTPPRNRGMRSRKARRWTACVHRLWPSTQQRAGKCLRIPDPARYSAPWVSDHPPGGMPLRIADMPQRIRCMRAGNLPRLGWSWDSLKFSHCSSPSSIAAWKLPDCASAHAVTTTRARSSDSRLDRPRGCKPRCLPTRRSQDLRDHEPCSRKR